MSCRRIALSFTQYSRRAEAFFMPHGNVGRVVYWLVPYFSKDGLLELEGLAPVPFSRVAMTDPFLGRGPWGFDKCNIIEPSFSLSLLCVLLLPSLGKIWEKKILQENTVLLHHTMEVGINKYLLLQWIEAIQGSLVKTSYIHIQFLAWVLPRLA